MTRHTLGISSFYHDSAAAIVTDSTVVAAAQEERFTRKKHDPSFPQNAINYCLGEAFLETEELEAVAFYDNSSLTIDRVIRSAQSIAPEGRKGFEIAIQSVLGEKANLKSLLEKSLGSCPPIWTVDHHISHAASAFYPSPFFEAAILTVDGVGEHTTLSIGFGKGRELDLINEIKYPHSLGSFILL